MMSKRQIQVIESREKAELLRPPEQKPIQRSEQRPAQTLAPQVAYRHAQVNRNGLRPMDILALQRTVGNRRVQRMVAQHEGADNEIQRQPLPVPVRPPPPMRPPLQSIPGGRTTPGVGRPIRTPEGAPRYAPDPYDDSLEAALERGNIRDYAERQRINEERPIATIDRGGQAPGFVTEHGTRRYTWIGGPGGGGSVTVRIRWFHVLDAIEHEVGQVSNEEQLQTVVNRYFPTVGLLNQAIEMARVAVH